MAISAVLEFIEAGFSETEAIGLDNTRQLLCEQARGLGLSPADAELAANSATIVLCRKLAARKVKDRDSHHPETFRQVSQMALMEMILNIREQHSPSQLVRADLPHATGVKGGSR